MKKVISLLIVMSLLVAICTPTLSVLADNEEVKINKTSMISFEDYNGTLTSAFPSGVSSMKDSALSIRQNPYLPETKYGTYSLHHSYEASNNQGILKIDYPFIRNHVYEIRVAYYFVDMGGDYVYTDASGKYVPWFSIWTDKKELGAHLDTTNKGVWREYSTTYTATEASTYLKLITNKSEAYYDNITITDVTTPKTGTYISTDFSNVQTEEGMSILAGRYSSVAFENDETKGNVAACTLLPGDSVDQKIYLPCKLKPNTNYVVTMTYKSSEWATWCYRDNASSDVYGGGIAAATEWTTKTWSLQNGANNKYLGLRTTVSPSVDIDIASISIKECGGNNTDNTWQMSNFDNYTLTSTHNYTQSGTNADGVENTIGYLANKQATGTTQWQFNNTITLKYSLAADKVHKLSFDYYGSAMLKMTLSDGSTNSQIISAIEPITEVLGQSGDYTYLESDTWQTYELIFTTSAAYTTLKLDIQYQANDFGIKGDSTLYFDDLCIEQAKSYSATASSAANGTAKVQPTSGYDGSTATFEAIPNTGYMFVGWLDSDTDELVSTNQVYIHVFNGADVALTATFDLFEKTTYDFTGGELPLEQTQGTNSGYIVADDPTNANNKCLTNIVYNGADGKRAYSYLTLLKLKAGHTYSISYNAYTADASPEMQFYAGVRTYVNDVLKQERANRLTQKAQWQTWGDILTATTEGEELRLLCADKTYFDDITIVDLTEKEDENYFEAFEQAGNWCLLDKELNATLTFAENRIHNKVATIDFTSGSAYEYFVKIPYRCQPDNAYYLEVTYRLNAPADKDLAEGEFEKGVGFAEETADSTKPVGQYSQYLTNTNLDGVNTSWYTMKWYVFRSKEVTKPREIGFGANAQYTIDIADISITSSTKIPGDVDNDYDVDPIDRSLLIDYLFGITGETVFIPDLDVNRTLSINRTKDNPDTMDIGNVADLVKFEKIVYADSLGSN